MLCVLAAELQLVANICSYNLAVKRDMAHT